MRRATPIDSARVRFLLVISQEAQTQEFSHEHQAHERYSPRKRPDITNFSYGRGGAHQLLTTVAGGDGIWRQSLPAVPASPTPHKLAFKASTGETAAIENVLFGDVYLCGGQSNMQFSMPVIENSTQEIARADG